MTRATTLTAARAFVISGGFAAELAPRIAIRSESPRADALADHLLYLNGEMRPLLEGMGFTVTLIDNPVLPRLPAIIAQRIEDPALKTVLLYGHGDVLWGMEGDWKDGRSPWVLDQAEGRLYGRGTVDNKGQHALNLAALRIVLRARGRLGFNVKLLLEMGEECGSPGLNEMAVAHQEALAADCLIASDGPRAGSKTPTVFLGARGAATFTLTCALREGGHHSGNWGGLLVNPGLRLAQALSVITDPMGKILIPDWVPQEVAADVRSALQAIEMEVNPGDPLTDPAWGEPGLTGAAQTCGWCNFEVLAYLCGRPEAPVNAIPGSAMATCQLRYTVDIDSARILPALREHLDAHGFQDVVIEPQGDGFDKATRTSSDNDWVRLVLASIEKTLGRPPALQPNFGGSLPNPVFADTLGLPTIWIPHSHPACSQHAPNEHMLLSAAEEGIAMMAGLFWDLGGA
ncbi:M20 family metallopeptidase [Pararhodobacter zhoushanensis]|uniref:M20 family metallopeptidase n=1 Tax=Pararhodobacter zhoushanensis TaxID=2479545 RepID=A0ABT3GUS4_9RHOB|nr:M20 family metallopeptidase [Pararhodobacter zhoushanensis]MCW1931264.1 M20 family metallopeptidase [Pararhodobacter zhoushanensis]